MWGENMTIKDTTIYKDIRKTYYALKNWDETKDRMAIVKKLRPYHDIHKGERCFVIGNGPSLKAEDLTRIWNLDIPTFACNRIYMIFPQTEWRPTYYFISDAKIVAQYTDDVEGVPVDHRFFPKRCRDKIKKGIFYNELESDYEKDGKFSLNASEGIYTAGTVTAEMLQFAYFMGFSEIYLIGVDFSYAITNKIDDRTYKYGGETNYFVKDYLKPGEVADMPNIKANLLGFHAAREAIEAQGRVIANATRGGKLEVFDRVNLDELLKKWEEEQR